MKVCSGTNFGSVRVFPSRYSQFPVPVKLQEKNQDATLLGLFSLASNDLVWNTIDLQEGAIHDFQLVTLYLE
jgi:hypothetical protein